MLSGPFDSELAFPQGLDVLPDALVVDWEAMASGNVLAVLSVVEAWRLAAERGSITGPVWPYDYFEIKMSTRWVRVLHMDRYTFFDGTRVHEKKDYSEWRP